MAGEGAEAGAVDEGLGVLDAGADGERFCFDVDAAAVQHGEGVAGAVADREDDGVGVDLVSVGQGQASDVAVGVEFEGPRRATRNGIRRLGPRFWHGCTRRR